MTLVLLLLLVPDVEAYVTREADVWTVACEALPHPAAAEPSGAAFPLLAVAAQGDPSEVVVPEIAAPEDTPRMRNLAEVRAAARERLQAWLDEHAAEILERRDAGTIALGELVIRPRGLDSVRLEPLDPASSPDAPAYVADVDQEIRRIFRCRQSETERDIDPAVIALLAEASWFFQSPIELISGYRARRFSTRRGSRHIQGRASDVRLDDVPMDVLADFFTILSDGPYGPLGVGRYPRDGFVHVDTRDETFFWTEGRRRRRDRDRTD